ncbi:MAG: phosphatidylserine decarboxylase [Rhodospirillales bacterium]|nr:MAG: phosphatidylserine decarboxylase [Rhodospirillales bacterium]
MSRPVLDSVLMPIHPAGWPFIAVFAVVALGLAWLHPVLGLVGAVATFWCLMFFRNPYRVTPVRSGLVVGAADGMIQSVTEAPPPPELDLGEAPLTRISVFMNVFDVHVNRIPADGTVTRLAYRPGRFVNASLDKASEDNERQGVVITLADGRRLGVVQIAGLVARRILCQLKEGEPVKAGARFGMIRFGSRVDVYLPPGVSPMVIEGQRCIAGETVIADLEADESPRCGARR